MTIAFNLLNGILSLFPTTPWDTSGFVTAVTYFKYYFDQANYFLPIDLILHLWWYTIVYRMLVFAIAVSAGTLKTVTLGVFKPPWDMR